MCWCVSRSNEQYPSSMLRHYSLYSCCVYSLLDLQQAGHCQLWLISSPRLFVCLCISLSFNTSFIVGNFLSVLLHCFWVQAWSFWDLSLDLETYWELIFKVLVLILVKILKLRILVLVWVFILWVLDLYVLGCESSNQIIQAIREPQYFGNFFNKFKHLNVTFGTGHHEGDARLTISLMSTSHYHIATLACAIKCSLYCNTAAPNWIKCKKAHMPPDKMSPDKTSLCSAVCLSVCLFNTLVYCIQTA